MDRISKEYVYLINEFNISMMAYVPSIWLVFNFWKNSLKLKLLIRISAQ